MKLCLDDILATETITATENVENGTTTISNEEGCITYVPNAGFVGEEIITVIVCDENDLTQCHEEAFVVVIGCLPPYAIADQVSITPESVSINGTTVNTTNGYNGVTIDVAGNDYNLCDDLADVFNISVDEQPANGTVTVDADGNVIYTPNADFEGTDIITYEACNTCGSCNTTTVVVNVTQPEPVTPCPEDYEWTVELCTQPITPITICPDFCIEDAVVINATTLFDCSLEYDGGCLTYTALPGFFDNEIITIFAENAAGETETATAYVAVVENCDQAAPIAQADAAVTDANTPVTLNVLTNDVEPNGEEMTITSFTDPSNGTIEWLPDGTVTYTPNADFVGTDVFTYEVCDSNDLCSTATVTVIVEDVSCEPYTEFLCVEPIVAVELCPTFCIDNPVIVDATPTFFDCSLTILDNGCVRYVALPGFNATDVVVITAINEFGEEEEAIFTVSAEDDCEVVENQAPAANDDEAISNGGETVNINVLGNDIDPEGDVLGISTFTQPLNGTVTQVGDILIYTPNAGYDGIDEFTYQVCDESGNCDVGTVVVEVIAAGCDSNIFLCAEPIQPVEICPTFCDISGNISIESVNTTYNCSISYLEGGEVCFTYTALPLFIGDETITVVGINEFGQRDTVYVHVTVTEDCGGVAGGSDADGSIGKETESVAEVTEVMLTNIMPVPANDFITVSYMIPNADSATEITVYDLTGKVVMTKQLDAPKGMNMSRMNIANLPAGIYMLKLTTNDTTVNAKFVKQ